MGKRSLWIVPFFLLLVAIATVAGGEPEITILPEGGSIRLEGGRVDLYDAKSNRTGYGYVRPDGSMDVFNLDGTRRATVTPGIGGQPARIIIPHGKR